MPKYVRELRLLRLDEKTIDRILMAPGMPTMIALSDDLQLYLRKANVGSLLGLRRSWTNRRLAYWQPYQEMERGIIPSDALTVTDPAGIPPYFLPDLKFIDSFGLTDATIARNPVTREPRYLAHERQPPPGYLAERGVNFRVFPAAASAQAAMSHGLYAVQVGPALWMPFDAPSREWVAARFAQFKSTLENSRLLMRGPFDVYLGPGATMLLFYVKDRCDPSEPAVFLHIVPAEVADLPASRRQYGFGNHDFIPPRPWSSGKWPSLTQSCVVRRWLPDYPIAAIRTGQYVSESGERLWGREFRFGDSGNTENPRD